MLKFMDLDKWLELTAVLIFVYLILANYQGFNVVTNSLGNLYTSSVKVLQGR